MPCEIHCGGGQEEENSPVVVGVLSWPSAGLSACHLHFRFSLAVTRLIRRLHVRRKHVSMRKNLTF